MPGAVVAVIAMHCFLSLPATASAQAAAIQPDTLAVAPLSTSQSIKLLLEDVCTDAPDG